MFLQLALLAFAVQWLGAPWQLEEWKAVCASVFFLGVAGLSIIPAYFHGYDSFKNKNNKRMLIICLLQIFFFILQFILPGIGELLWIIYNIALMFLLVGFSKLIATGCIVFSLWFVGLNYILDKLFLEDPRGVWAGDLYLNITDWAILGVFIAALARTIYLIYISYPVYKLHKMYDISYIRKIRDFATHSSNELLLKLRLEGRLPAQEEKQEVLRKVADRIENDVKGDIKPILDHFNKSLESAFQHLPEQVITGNMVKFNKSITAITTSVQDKVVKAMDKRFGDATRPLSSKLQADNERLGESEKRVSLLLLVIAALAIIAAALIQPPWRQEVMDDLKTGFAAVSEHDYETAKTVAKKYYSETKILYNGDVFYLNGLVAEEESPEAAIQFFEEAAAWYDEHQSYISQSNHANSYYRLAVNYMNKVPPDYYEARNAINKALELEPTNSDYAVLQSKVKENLEGYEREEHVGFFQRIRNNIRAMF